MAEIENIIINKAACWGAERLINIDTQRQYSVIDKKKMVFNLEIFIINITKTLIIYGCSLIFGNILHTLMMHLSFIATKRFSYGLHAKNSTVCTLYSIGVFVFLPFVAGNITINSYLAYFVFIIIIALHALYAPADTQAMPLLGAKKRALLKKRSVIAVIVLMALTSIISDPVIKTLILMGSVCQTLNILPITYKILGRSVKNYEKYEF